jgi:hypothetical protein
VRRGRGLGGLKVVKHRRVVLEENCTTPMGCTTYSPSNVKFADACLSFLEFLTRRVKMWIAVGATYGKATK